MKPPCSTCDTISLIWTAFKNIITCDYTDNLFNLLNNPINEREMDLRRIPPILEIIQSEAILNNEAILNDTTSNIHLNVLSDIPPKISADLPYVPKLSLDTLNLSVKNSVNTTLGMRKNLHGVIIDPTVAHINLND